MTKSSTITTGFYEHVVEGLSAAPKRLSSMYFYDETGDRLFQEIMDLPEYYLTKSELEIFNAEKEELRQLFAGEGTAFNLIEFGAGDGLKTRVLIEHFLAAGTSFRYLPIDISDNALQGLVKNLKAAYRDLDVAPFQGEYFEAISEINRWDQGKKVVMFLGSNIGNFSPEAAVSFMQQLADELSPGDGALIGFDLKKNPKVIHDAYNDAQGVTKAFNINLLQRMNNELSADFMLDQFDHYPTYDPLTGEARSFLVSLKQQVVSIGSEGVKIKFEKGEVIHTEISRKFAREDIEELARMANMKVVRWLYDCRHYYTDVYMERI